ncbi:hypothetical protein [Paludisphaera rhizosphaerae]|uniref:hypothetical protein n=1 Tax=Paludisphaera rhizosphaerae TaxID=2711216 RepID=UPI0013EC99EE|nr:hypothetical protein [Paludisphaera rhizosphaerae]
MSTSASAPSLKSSPFLGVLSMTMGLFLIVWAVFSQFPGEEAKTLPDESLTNFRGLNPDFVKTESGTCLSENIATETAFDPPGPPSVVGFGCAENRQGVTCITCGASFDPIKNWIAWFSDVAPDGGTEIVSPMGTFVLCGNENNSGQKGTCQLNSNPSNPQMYCAFSTSYSCTTGIAEYEDQ